MSDRSPAKIRKITARPVLAPLPKPHKTANYTIEKVPLVLFDVEVGEVVGRSYIFGYGPRMLRPLVAMAEGLSDVLVGQVLDPVALAAQMDAVFRLVGHQGVTRMVTSGIDMAIWDAMAQSANQSLVEHLGGVAKPIPVYDSLGMMDADETVRDVEACVSAGYRAVKVKAGRADASEDVDVLRAIRSAVPSEMAVMMDFNQSFEVEDAIRRVELLEPHGLDWIEEPVRAENDAGHGEVTRRVSTPVQLGENWWGVDDFRRAVAAGAGNLAMPDAMKIGGVSGWLETARYAEEVGRPVSAHLFLEFSAHLMAVTPTAQYLEGFDVAAGILKQPVQIVDGALTAANRPGAGLMWDEKAVERYRI